MNTSYAIWNTIENKWYGEIDDEWKIQFTTIPSLFCDDVEAQQAIDMVLDEYEDFLYRPTYDEKSKIQIEREHFEIKTIEWMVKEEL